MKLMNEPMKQEISQYTMYRCIIPFLLVANFLSPLWLSSFVPTVDGAKILGLFAHPSESHFTVMRSIVLELAKRQHNVTYYTYHGIGQEDTTNLQEHVVKPEFNFWQELQKHALGDKGKTFELAQLDAKTMQKSLGFVGAAAVDHFLGNEKLQSLLKLNGYEFDYDLIIVDLFYTEALLSFGYYYNTPVIGLLSSDFENYMQQSIDSFVPVACSPIDYELSAFEGDYWERLSNIRNCISRRKIFEKHNLMAQEQLITKYFGKREAPVPSMGELQSKLAVLLVNNHVPLMTPRPLMPNIIAAGGLHIRPTKELPWHVKRFVEESRAGVIYVNLGNELLCGDIPASMLQSFYDVLSKYKEHVLWTCHDLDTLPDMPKNFHVQHMAPQTDILAHPHVKVFIMNGDLMSLEDGIIRHVPMIGIPLFRNQIQNMELAVRLGAAVKIDYSNLTSTSLTWALQQLLYDEFYPLSIRDVATMFRDRPLGALETAIYWINYVVKHSGGAFIRTKGVGTPSNQLHLFDLFLFYFFVAALIVSSLVGLFFLSVWFYQKKQEATKMPNKQN